eukprot:TRINITY_DN1346_c0_g1_i1.p1 TRINITY_DN1346_c0_g1~~TRINITY_DN1346_c0_g1_i1.p1  ORF type:complete len:219 (+),score=51.09 TRINITY_DN1346_c0_g1_i1:34-690(+)
MPATAGRVRMPANNRVHSSAALQTHGIWQSAIGYDPYAPENNNKDDDGGGKPTGEAQDNAYDSFQGLLALARLTGSNADETRGACKKCHRVGHLTFQCRNFLTAKEEVGIGMDLVGGGKEDGTKEGGDKSGEEESDVSDSEEDEEKERALRELARAKGLLGGGESKHGRAQEKKRKSSSKRKKEKKHHRADKERKKRSSSAPDRKRRHRRRTDSSDSD